MMKLIFNLPMMVSVFQVSDVTQWQRHMATPRPPAPCAPSYALSGKHQKRSGSCDKKTKLSQSVERLRTVMLVFSSSLMCTEIVADINNTGTFAERRMLGKVFSSSETCDNLSIFSSQITTGLSLFGCLMHSPVRKWDSLPTCLTENKSYDL